MYKKYPFLFVVYLTFFPWILWSSLLCLFDELQDDLFVLLTDIRPTLQVSGILIQLQWKQAKLSYLTEK